MEASVFYKKKDTDMLYSSLIRITCLRIGPPKHLRVKHNWILIFVDLYHQVPLRNIPIKLAINY